MCRPDASRHVRPDVRGNVRLSDADRDDAIVRLSEHYAAGRLDKDEFDERSDAVWTARTGSDLAPVFADLGPVPSERSWPGPGSGPRGRRGWFPVPFVPVLIVLIALSVWTHIPFALLALAGLLVLVARRRGRLWRSRRPLAIR